MTSQSVPISRTRKDYIQSTIAVFLIILFSVLSVYFTNPDKTRPNATTKMLGIEIPNWQGIVMRQPRMAIALIVGVLVFYTSFLFMKKDALPFFSRMLAWSSVVAISIILGLVWFFNGDGVNSSWFRFFLLFALIVLTSTVMAELMIFYRRFFDKKSWRKTLWHRLAFAVVCTVIAFGAIVSYYHWGVENGVILNYGQTTQLSNPTTQTPGTQNPAPVIPDASTPLTPQDSSTVTTSAQ